MKRSIIFCLSVLLLTACGGDSGNNGNGEKIEGLIKIDGSSTVYPITEAVAEEFNGVHPKARVMVGVSGTGGGFKKFCAGETDINNASRPIKPTEVALCEEQQAEYIELPVAYDGLAIVVSKDNTWVDYITVEELNKIWAPESQGEITRWNQVRASWPDEPINLYGPGVDSGTFDYFTEAINGKSGSSRGDYTASEDDNVIVQGISTDPNSLGYFGLAYYEENQNKLKAVPVKASNDAEAIMPSLETVKKGTYTPLSRPLFVYVRKASADDKSVKAFMDFYLEEAGELAKEVGYVPLPDNIYAAAQERLENRVTGSIYKEGTHAVGVSLEELMGMEAAPADTAVQDTAAVQ